MAIDPVLTSTASLAGGPSSRPAERLSELVRTLKDVAAQLDTEGQSQRQKTVLRARFNDLQRQVNRLDGIVSGEGLETSGQEAVTRSATVDTSSSSPPAQSSPVQSSKGADTAPVEPAPAPAPAQADSQQIDVTA